APIPPPPEPLSSEDHRKLYEEEYRKKLVNLIKPLLRHAMRYWELTLRMIERTGVQTEWTQQIHVDLDCTRQRLADSSPDTLTPPKAPGPAPPSPNDARATPRHAEDKGR